jgi:FtsH-binding integral membrane protein
MHSGAISIWFFIGISLLVNGVLIAGAGIWEWAHPPLNQVVLFQLHANLWWGLVLAAFGALYCYKFAPRRAS